MMQAVGDGMCSANGASLRATAAGTASIPFALKMAQIPDRQAVGLRE